MDFKSYLHKEKGLKLHKLSFSLLIFSLNSQLIRAYDPQKVHPLMSEKSAGATYNFDRNSYEEFSLNSTIKALRKGATEEDYLGGINFGGLLPGLRGPMHFYNPMTHKGLNITERSTNHQDFPTALSVAEIIWSQAIDVYPKGESSGLVETQQKKLAYEYLGHVLHLAAQDMAQPAHVHNDPHLPHILGDDSTVDLPKWENLAIFNNQGMVPVPKGTPLIHV